MPNATDDWTSVDDRASQLVQTKLSLIQGSQFYTACQRDTQITGCYLLLNESDMSISAIQLNNIDSLLYACFNIIYFLIESTTSFSGCRLKQLSCILSQCWILLQFCNLFLTDAIAIWGGLYIPTSLTSQMIKPHGCLLWQKLSCCFENYSRINKKTQSPHDHYCITNKIVSPFEFLILMISNQCQASIIKIVNLLFHLLNFWQLKRNCNVTPTAKQELIFFTV